MISTHLNNRQIPDVSVIIPTYNRISMLKDALSTVFSQEFDGTLEIIVVDDNSQDGTSEFISQKYPEIRLISLQQNVGVSAARNRAILEAKGKYIAFLDSDDLWEPNYLKTQISALEGKDRCFCVSDLVMWNTVKNRKTINLQRPDLARYTSPIHHALVSGFIRTPSSVVLPRQALDEVGLFDESMKVGEDADLYLRCLIFGYSPIFSGLPVALKRVHGKSQLNDFRNLELRKKCRFLRVDKYYTLTEGRSDVIPRSRVYAEIHAHFANLHFKNNDFQKWLVSSIDSARYASPGYALLNMMSDLKMLLQGTIPAKIAYELEKLSKHRKS